MTVTLNGKAMVDRPAAHSHLVQQLELPSWYGRNLDALHDCLTTISEETKLTFLHFPSLPFPSAGLLRVLRDSENENEKLEISFVTN